MKHTDDIFQKNVVIYIPVVKDVVKDYDLHFKLLTLVDKVSSLYKYKGYKVTITPATPTKNSPTHTLLTKNGMYYSLTRMSSGMLTSIIVSGTRRLNFDGRLNTRDIDMVIPVFDQISELVSNNLESFEL